MPIADLTQPLEVTGGRHDHAARALHGLDDHGGDGRGVVQRDESLEFLGQVRSPFRLAARECHLGGAVRVRQVIDALHEERCEHLAVRGDPADRNPA